MWDEQEYLERALKRKKRATYTLTIRGKKANMCLKRTIGELIVDSLSTTSSPVALPCQIILNDFSPKGVSVFLPQSLPLGTPVRVTISGSGPLVLQGKISACQHIVLNPRIISEHAYSYKVWINFQFISDENRESIQAYYNELLNNYLKAE